MHDEKPRLVRPRVTLLLLPGLDGTGLLLRNFAASFDPNVQVVIASYPTGVASGYADLEPIVRSILPRNTPFFILGESFSGPIAISIAASRPPGLLGVILSCSFARNPLPQLSFVRNVVRLLPLRSVPIRLLSYFVLGRFASSSLRDDLAAALQQLSRATLAARAKDVLGVDVSALLAEVDVPVLCLRGIEDRLVPPQASQRIAAIARDCRMVQITAPHFLLQVQPLAAAAAVAAFMNGIQQAPGEQGHSSMPFN